MKPRREVKFDGCAGHEPCSEVCFLKFDHADVLILVLCNMAGRCQRPAVHCVMAGAAETEFSLVRFNGDKERAAAVYKVCDPVNCCLGR